MRVPKLKFRHINFSIFIFLISTGFATQFMDVSEIKPGMHGIGKTVFTQTKIEDFGVEIIDVMRNVSPHGDVILARLSGGSIPGGLEKTGVIAGMSGSPVYIDGKLIGAVAYSWSFQKEPIAGITPIREMLEIIEVDKQSKTSPKNQGFQWTMNQNSLSHIPIPVAFSSSVLSEHQEFIAQLGDLLPGHGLLPVFAAGVSSDTIPIELEPGAAVGISLIQGDMQVAGIGTLTYRDGDKILAFGHPMLLGGKVEFPMVGGIIHSVMPSQAISFKIFSPTPPVGIVTQDRANGIMGKFGKTTTLIPVKVQIHSPGIDTTYSYGSIDHKILFPTLLRTIILNSIVAQERIFGESTIKADMTLLLETGRGLPQAVDLHRMLSGDESTIGIVNGLAEPVADLLENEFEKVKVKNITIKLDIENEKRITRIEKLVVDKEKVKPGDSVEIGIVLRSVPGKVYTKTTQIQIPKETPAGNLILLVANADSTHLIERSRTAESFTPKSFTQLVEQLEILGKGNEIQISGYIRQKGVVVQAQELPNPPQFLKQVLARPKNQVAFTESSLILRHSLTTKEIIEGVASLILIVER